MVEKHRLNFRLGKYLKIRCYGSTFDLIRTFSFTHFLYIRTRHDILLNSHLQIPKYPEKSRLNFQREHELPGCNSFRPLGNESTHLHRIFKVKKKRKKVRKKKRRRKSMKVRRAISERSALISSIRSGAGNIGPLRRVITLLHRGNKCTSYLEARSCQQLPSYSKTVTESFFDYASMNASFRGTFGREVSLE